MKRSALVLMIVGTTLSLSFAADIRTATPIAQAQPAEPTIGSYQRLNGYFSHQMETGNGDRDIEVYIPEGARRSASPRNQSAVAWASGARRSASQTGRSGFPILVHLFASLQDECFGLLEVLEVMPALERVARAAGGN